MARAARRHAYEPTGLLDRVGRLIIRVGFDRCTGFFPERLHGTLLQRHDTVTIVAGAGGLAELPQFIFRAPVAQLKFTAYCAALNPYW